LIQASIAVPNDGLIDAYRQSGRRRRSPANRGFIAQAFDESPFTWVSA
jgi:hypothetical protein